MEIIGNYKYAGTNKFVSHAVTLDGNFTYCGMEIHELMYRRGQEWELNDSDVCGCIKCNKKLNRENAH